LLAAVDFACREVVSALQLVFGHMQGSSESVHDLAPLATLLELNTTGILCSLDNNNANTMLIQCGTKLRAY
jgi:hypothetical protein